MVGGQRPGGVATQGLAVGTGAGDRGQVVPLVVVAMLVALVALGLMLAIGGAVVDRSRASTAADAAALAGVTGGRAAAAAEAEANGATLESWQTGAGWVEVTVRVRGRQATARAAPGRPGRVATGAG